MYKNIKSELLRREISFRFEDDAFHFQHPKFPNVLDCIITEEDGQMRFIADYELLTSAETDGDKLCSLINKVNYDNDFGNLETDGNGLIVFKLNTFLFRLNQKRVGYALAKRVQIKLAVKRAHGCFQP
jgi:hypothetical protein